MTTNTEPLTTAHKQCGFQSNLQAQFPQASSVTGDRFAATQSLTAHTLDR